MKSAAALLLVGMLILWTELPTGSTWSCPHIRITCARPNPPNQCGYRKPCPPHQKCCPSFCGLRCFPRPALLPD
ncbi:ELAF protein, partial [Crotophaga sulcirostris]|nr:ELAF protein [Crotophaga sulcirostris]